LQINEKNAAMKIICFPHFYYLSEVSRLVEMGQALRRLGQEVVFFSHGGGYEYVAREAGFEVTAVVARKTVKFLETHS
jgi:UDP:flavonoid glycosyltransferase YjiC (YdhE family)